MYTLDMREVVQADCCSSPDLAAIRTDERDPLLDAFRALADPTRLEIFRLIAAQPEPICVCHITAAFAVSQPTISHHLRVLRDADLVTVARRGVWAYYAADPGGLERVREALGGLMPRPLLAAR